LGAVYFDGELVVKYFFDVPVYRIPAVQYNRERDAYIEANLNQNAGIRDHLWNSYGGCWQFNEIIGYIRLHFVGTQVRGEYFGVNGKRIVRTRTLTFAHLTHKLVPEVEIAHPITSASILAAVKVYLDNCKKELPRRYIDTELFEAIANHLDWHALYLK
jgi:hypothetical protein